MQNKLDFRLAENRREGYIRWTVWSARTTDADPPIEMMKYIFDRQELNIEQRFWLCFLYANTYQLPMAYTMYNEFPDYINVDQDRLEWWNNDNYKNLRYQSDMKWVKGKLPILYESYRKNVGPNQKEFFDKVCSSPDPYDNYQTLRILITNHFKHMGRYTAFFYQQVLKHCCGLNIDAPTLLLGEYGSESHTNGACYASNKENWLTSYYEEGKTKKIKRDVTYTTDMKQYLEDFSSGVLKEIHERYPDTIGCVDNFLLETTYCSFKKLFRRRQGRYLGSYLDRQAEDIKSVENLFDKVDWDICWDYRKEKLHEFTTKDRGFTDSVKCQWFLDTGDFPGLGIYDDLRNGG